MGEMGSWTSKGGRRRTFATTRRTIKRRDLHGVGRDFQMRRSRTEGGTDARKEFARGRGQVGERERTPSGRGRKKKQGKDSMARKSSLCIFSGEARMLLQGTGGRGSLLRQRPKARWEIRAIIGGDKKKEGGGEWHSKPEKEGTI